jgi:hypothetical protein
MLIVETIARIRREHFIKGKTIKEIARDLKVSRNTVSKVQRSGETSFEYERVVQPRPRSAGDHRQGDYPDQIRAQMGPTVARSPHSVSASSICGHARYGGAVKRIAPSGRESNGWRTTSSPDRVSFIRGPISDSPSDARGGSRMP